MITTNPDNFPPDFPSDPSCQLDCNNEYSTTGESLGLVRSTDLPNVTLVSKPYSLRLVYQVENVRKIQPNDNNTEHGQ